MVPGFSTSYSDKSWKHSRDEGLIVKRLRLEVSAAITKCGNDDDIVLTM